LFRRQKKKGREGEPRGLRLRTPGKREKRRTSDYAAYFRLTKEKGTRPFPFSKRRRVTGEEKGKRSSYFLHAQPKKKGDTFHLPPRGKRKKERKESKTPPSADKVEEQFKKSKKNEKDPPLPTTTGGKEKKRGNNSLRYDRSLQGGPSSITAKKEMELLRKKKEKRNTCLANQSPHCLAAIT